MWIHLRLVRLRGDLSCVQIIVVSLHISHAGPRWTTLMRSTVTSSHLFALSWGRRPLQAISLQIFSLNHCRPKYSLWKNGPYPEDPLCRSGLTGSQNPPSGHLLCSNNSSNPYTVRILGNFGSLLCAPMPCMAISMLTSCENLGIISLPIIKLTIPRGPNLILAPEMWADVVHFCTLSDSCSYICDLCGSVGVSPVFK